jgi:hypothetical protein
MKKDRFGSERFRLKAGLRNFRFWLWLIRMIGVIVPRRLRANWRLEWEAELRHREELLAEWDRLDWRGKVDLLRRSTSAFWDAFGARRTDRRCAQTGFAARAGAGVRRHCPRPGWLFRSGPRDRKPVIQGGRHRPDNFYQPSAPVGGSRAAGLLASRATGY